AEVTGDDATDSWYSEVKKYDFKKSGFQSGSGHFTQVVWKDSKEFAIAKAGKGSKVFVVARYRPAGNFLSAFNNNVFPKQ
ncbi:Golgi-associated plant pathogenesis-related protein 1, partial [Exaiptasia diaphana]